MVHSKRGEKISQERNDLFSLRGHLLPVFNTGEHPPMSLLPPVSEGKDQQPLLASGTIRKPSGRVPLPLFGPTLMKRHQLQKLKNLTRPSIGKYMVH